MNANEIVRGLRESCTGNEFAPPMVTNRELTEAADMIESLQAQHKQAALNYQQKCRDVVELEAQLSASQRREKAAVEDLTKLATKPITPCHSCAKTCVFLASLAPECQPPTWCREWQWRGFEKGEHNA